MGKKFWFGVMAALILCAFCTTESSPDTDDIANDLSTAIEELQTGEVNAGVERILGAVTGAAESAGLSEDFMRKMTEIREQENFFSPNTPVLLRDAFELAGYDVEFPDSTGEVGTVAEAVRMKLQEAQERIRMGDSNQAVRKLLESLMVMMPAPPQ